MPAPTVSGRSRCCLFDRLVAQPIINTQEAKAVFCPQLNSRPTWATQTVREKLGSTHCVIPALGEQEGNLVYMAGSRSEKGIPGTRGKPDSNRKLTER